MSSGSSHRLFWVQKRAGQRGQAIVELTLTLPLLLILLLGLIEMGHAMNAYLTIVAAGRDSARLGAQLGVANTLPLKNAVTQETGRLKAGPVPGTTSCTAPSGVCITSNCTLDSSAPCGAADKWVKVEVCYNHPFIVGIPWVMEGPLKMCSQTKMRIAL